MCPAMRAPSGGLAGEYEGASTCTHVNLWHMCAWHEVCHSIMALSCVHCMARLFFFYTFAHGPRRATTRVGAQLVYAPS